MDQEIAEVTRIEKEEEVVDDDDDDTLKDMILSSEVPYLTIDRRTGGYIARVFNSN
jgi:glutaredoxin 2